MKDKKDFSDLGSTETAVRSADVDEDRRLLWSEGAVPLQRDDDDDDDGFVSPLKATVNFADNESVGRKYWLTGKVDKKTVTFFIDTGSDVITILKFVG